MDEAVSDRSWVQAMLDVESALARAEAKTGVIPAAAADEIASQCRATEFDLQRIGREAVESANPVIPLVKALRLKVSAPVASAVHVGVTSQDILDTAMMLVARRAIGLMLADLDRAAGSCATLADRHRATVMAGRTLMQQAVVTSFGLKAAGWLVPILEARDNLSRIRDHRLALQLGGAVGSFAALGDRGPAVAREMALRLSLPEPVIAWHSDRTRIAELAAAIAVAAGVAGKIALDVVLLAQTEVAEVKESPKAGRGGSSAMPQKQNPVAAIEILAAVRGVQGVTPVLMGTLLSEHERAAGAWQAEWPALTESFRQGGGALSRLASLLSSLDIDPERMRSNLELGGGLIVSEQLVTMLGERIDRRKARAMVEAAVATSKMSDRPFASVVRDDPEITAQLEAADLDRALDPGEYLGSSSSLIDRALTKYRASPASRGER